MEREKQNGRWAVIDAGIKHLTDSALISSLCGQIALIAHDDRACKAGAEHMDPPTRSLQERLLERLKDEAQARGIKYR